MASTKNISQPRIKVLIIDDMAETAYTIRKWLIGYADIHVIDTTTSIREGISLTARLHPDIVLMDVYMPDMDGFEATQLLNREFPTRVILMAPDKGNRELMMQEAMRVGARDILKKPLDIDILVETIRCVADMPIPQWGSGPLQPVATQTQEPHGHHLIAVCGSKGGVGTSIFALNLATALAMINLETVLIDACLRSPCDSYLLDKLPNTPGSLEDLFDHLDMDLETIRSIVARHPSGLNFLRVPDNSWELSDRITPELTRGVMLDISEFFDYVVVDVDLRLPAMAQPILENAERIFLITTLELTAVKRTHEFFNILKNLGISQDSCWMIGNRIDGGYQYKPVHLERSVGRRFNALLPDDVPGVISSVNSGVPIVLNHRHKSPLAKIIMDTARKLHEDLVRQNKAAKAKH
jgi:pilus assembly protein CpaE